MDISQSNNLNHMLNRTIHNTWFDHINIERIDLIDLVDLCSIYLLFWPYWSYKCWHIDLPDQSLVKKLSISWWHQCVWICDTNRCIYVGCVVNTKNRIKYLGELSPDYQILILNYLELINGWIVCFCRFIYIYFIYFIYFTYNHDAIMVTC